MSTISTAYNSLEDSSLCAKVIATIDNVNSITNVKRPTGVLDALNSPENRGTFSLVLDPNKDRPTSGSFRKVYTKDISPVCNQDTDAGSVCAAPSFSSTDDVAAGYVFAEHNIDLSIKREIILDLEDFKSLCEDPSTYLANRLLAFRSGVHQEVNTKVINRLIAYGGQYYGQSNPNNSINAPKDVSFLAENANGGFLFDPTGYAKIVDEYAKKGYAYTTPIIVGGSHVAVFKTNAMFMGGTNVNGVTATGVPQLYVDHQIDVEFGDGKNWLATWAPGHVQLLGVNEITDAMIALSVPNHREKMRVPDPFGTGLGDWDFLFDVDSTGCKYKLTWQKWFDAALPIPYDGTCATKPVLFFNADCVGNTCPENGYPSGADGID